LTNTNLNYEFSNSNNINTDIYCNINDKLVLNNSISNSGNYTLFLKLFDKTYFFQINYGEPDDIEISIVDEILTGQNAKLSISTEEFKDKCDNIIPIYEFPNKMEITYILTNNIIYNTTNKINYNSNILEYTSQDIIKNIRRFRISFFLWT